MFKFWSKAKYKVNEELLDEIENEMILSDIGLDFTDKIISFLKKQKFNSEITLEEINQIVIEKIADSLKPFEKELVINKNNKPYVILVFGTNGSGKTTTIAKLGNMFQALKYKAIFAAGDTFRSGAVEQLQALGNKLNIPVFSNPDTKDSAAVVYQAYMQAQKENYDVLIADTSGRFSNNSNLMDELQKINNTLKKIDSTLPNESILVLDGTLGQSALMIANGFLKEINISGLIFTKLDGSSKGGSVLPICNTLKIPVLYLGKGEKMEDLIPFNAQTFASNLLNS